jgi:hypothetical protein
MPFCPNCDAEYKGKLSVCPECGEMLTDPNEEEDLEDTVEEPHEGMLCLFRSPEKEESELAVQALRDAGIKFVFRPLGRVHQSEAYDGEFYVGEDDYDDAKEALEDAVGEIEDEL